MYCKYCGSKNKKNVKFCVNCGKKITSEEANETEEKAVVSTSNKVNGSFLQDNKAIIAIAVVIAIVLFLLGNGSGKGGNSPESVSKQFLEGLKTCNTNKVFNHIYSEDYDISKLTGSEKKEFMDEVCGEIDQYRILNSSMDGDQAEVEVELTGDGDSDEGTLYLVRVNKKWFIDIDKTF